MDRDEATSDPVRPARIRDILLRPARTWPIIARESATIGAIYRRHVLILAALPPIARLFVDLLLGHWTFGLHFRPAIGSALGIASAQYATSLIATFLLAMIVNALAPRYGGARDPVRAFKVVAYAATAVWIAGALATLPALGWLAAGQYYGLYLLYTGLPPLMRVPANKAMSCSIVTVIVAAAIVLAIGAVGGVAGWLSDGAPGLHRLQAAARQLKAEAKEVGSEDALVPVNIESP